MMSDVSRESTDKMLQSRHLLAHRERGIRMQDYPTGTQPPQVPPQMPPQMPLQAPPPFAPVAASGAPTPPQSNRNKLLIGGGIGCGVLLVLCLCAVIASALGSKGSTPVAQGGSSTTTQQSNTQAPAGTPLPTATAKPTATATPQPKWTVTHTYKGNGIKKTEPFTVNSDHWKIRWSCNPQAYGFSYNLIADLTPPGQDFGDSVVNVICTSNDPSSTSGETDEYTSGTFYLDVTSEGPWTFQILEFK